jgi:hypothetical protein
MSAFVLIFIRTVTHFSTCININSYVAYYSCAWIHERKKKLWKISGCLDWILLPTLSKIVYMLQVHSSSIIFSQVLWNSINLATYDPEILLVWHLTKISLKTGFVWSVTGSFTINNWFCDFVMCYVDFNELIKLLREFTKFWRWLYNVLIARGNIT